MIDHVALGARGFEATRKHLAGKGVAHRVNQVPNSPRWQIFLRDPNNVEIELNFETKDGGRERGESDSEDIMAKYLLVSFKTCPWVQRAAIVLREKNIEFEFRHIDRDNRPDWFLAISPHKKVPVLSIDGKVSLFESNAIAEYLDETIAPRLHPDDPVLRAINRAWTDYRADVLRNRDRAAPMRKTRRSTRRTIAKIPAGIRAAREGAGEGRRAVVQRREIFAGRCGLCAVPAALLLPRPHPADRPDREVSAAEGLGRHADEAAVDASFPEAEFEGLYRLNVKRRNKWLSQFVADAAMAAE